MLLTTRNLLEMSNFAMGSHVVASSGVRMEIAFSQPGVVVSSKTCRGGTASFHTGLERFEFSENLDTSSHENTFVDGHNLFCKHEKIIHWLLGYNHGINEKIHPTRLKESFNPMQSPMIM